MKNIRSLLQIIKDKYPSMFTAFQYTDQNINELLARIEALELKNLQYYCRATRDADLSVPTGSSQVPLTITEYPQFGNMHDNAINNERIYIRRNGVYVLHANTQWPADAAGTFRTCRIDLVRSGVTSVLAQTRVTSAAVILTQNVACSFYLYKDDYIMLTVAQDSGVNKTLTGNSPTSPTLSVMERREDLNRDQFGLLNPDANSF